MPVLRSLFALLAVATLVSADEVQSLGGKSVTGTVTAINDSLITVKTAAGPTNVPLLQVLAVKFRDIRPIDPAAKFTDVVLVDDTVLHCKKVDFQGKDVELTLLSGAALKVPVTSVVSFVREANNQPQLRKFEELAAKRMTKDRIIILRGDVLNTLEGTLGEVKGQTISFKSELNGNTVELPLEKLHGVIFFRGAVVPGTPICRVYDIEGNSLTAVKLAHDGAKLTLTTTLGNQLTLTNDQLSKLDFNLGKLTYLSDMIPVKTVEKSGIGLVTPYRKDLNLDGDPIQLDRPYSKGLSMHAYTDLEYNLNRKYVEFKATLGIDVRTGENSQPKVTIYGDDNVLFSGDVLPGKLQPISLRLKGVNVLRIVVSSRNVLDLHDHVTLADARVSQ